MTAEDVIRRWLTDSTTTPEPSSLLAALRAAGWAVVPVEPEPPKYQKRRRQWWLPLSSSDMQFECQNRWGNDRSGKVYWRIFCREKRKHDEAAQSYFEARDRADQRWPSTYDYLAAARG